MNITWLDKFNNKKILILGYGMEGKSTYHTLVAYCHHCTIQIMDRNSDYVHTCFEGNDHKPFIYGGEAYLSPDEDVDVVFKSPGIPLKQLEGHMPMGIITSQSNEFIQAYGNHIVGITGTKGKSTTASFMKALLDDLNVTSQLIGNIGKPAFDVIDPDLEQPVFVYELSSHQLETVKASPKYAIILNLFEEHLDHYHSYDHYAEAKMNIARWQSEDDYFIYGHQNQEIHRRSKTFRGMKLPITEEEVNRGIVVGESKVVAKYEPLQHTLNPNVLKGIKGHHNLINMSVAILVTMLMGKFEGHKANACAAGFKSLNHRLSFVKQFKGIDYYNDSISTIPQATIAATNAVSNTETIIVGGMNRGIDYSSLIEFIENNSGYKWIMLPDSGHEIADVLSSMPHIYKVEDMQSAVKLANEITSNGKACLLSPAAASYGFYKNFEERGHVFEACVEALKND